MPELTVYRQGRADGGIRTGIELDGDTIFSRFEDGGLEPDPTLLWYVDLRCKGPGVPGDAVEAKAWLLNLEELIRDGFTRWAAEIEAGADLEFYPLQWNRFTGVPGGVEMTIVCATNRRLWALSVPSLLMDVGTHWRERIEALDPAEWVA